MNKDQLDARLAVSELAQMGLVNITDPENPFLTFKGKKALEVLLNNTTCAEWVRLKIRSFVAKHGMSQGEAAIATMALATVIYKRENLLRQGKPS